MKNTDEKLWLESLLKNGVIELRCFKDKQIISGIYSDINIMVNNIKYAIKNGFNVYNTINPSNLTATNGNLRPYLKTTKNKDITRIKTLFFDFDPVREKGVQATPEQVGESFKMITKMSRWLYDQGFGWTSNIGFSGNGWHSYYAVDLDVNDKSMIDDLYTLLNKRFNSDLVSFDVSVKNSARIARTFGSINHKSGKRAYCEYDDGYNFTSRETIKSVTKKFTPPKIKPKHFVTDGIKTSGIKPNHSIIGDCSRAGLNPVETPEHNKYWLSCPNKANHSTQGDKDSVLWLNDNGFYSFHCSHDGCSHIKSKELEIYLNK